MLCSRGWNGRCPQDNCVSKSAEHEGRFAQNVKTAYRRIGNLKNNEKSQNSEKI